MPLAVAFGAYFGATFAALGILPACIFVVFERRCEPLATAFVRAVKSILGSKLLILLVPCPLKVVVEQAVHMLQRDVRGCTAFRRHVLWVSYGKLKHPFETFIAHAMVTC